MTPHSPFSSSTTVKLRRHLSLLTCVTLVACTADPAAPSGPTEFGVEVSRTRFVVRSADPATTGALEARRRSRTPGMISGLVVKGNGGFNTPWSWHLAPESIIVADVSIELCDGTPDMIEANVDAWIAGPRRFCPWSAVVVDRRPYVPTVAQAQGR